MRKVLLSLMTVVITAFSFSFSRAEGQLLLGYCDGLIATGSSGNITGVGGTNVTIGELIRIPSSMLAPYQGLQITGVHAGLADASAYPESLTGWIAATKDGERVASGTLSNPDAGWNSIMLDQPYTITGNEAELWIGFEFVQSRKFNVISFVGETNENGCWIGKNGNYTDFSSRDYGSLSIEGIIEGENLPQHDLSLASAATTYTMNKFGEPIKVDLCIVNKALVTAEKPVIEFSFNGTPSYTYEYDGSLDYRDKVNLRIEVPSRSIAEEGEVKIDLNLKWADGSVDEFQDDNACSLTTVLTKDLFLRKLVVEEATGGWCKWCVRGLVGMAYMREHYPDSFIGIGVHDGDAYEIKEYNDWMDGNISGYPSALANRVKYTASNGRVRALVIDPNAEEIEQYLNDMYPFSEYQLALTAELVSEGRVKFTTEMQFLVDNDNADYRLAFVVLEDKLPILQSNAYAGGINGEMGGFEDLPSHVNIEIDDVARAIYPSVDGSSELVPAQVVKGETYTVEYEAELPAIADGNNVWAVVMLLDGTSGEILQGAKVDTIDGLAMGIREVGSKAAPAIEQTIDLQGRRTDASSGLMIRGGSIVFLR